MIGLMLLVLMLLIGIGYFFYKNQQDKRDIQQLLHDTEADDEAHDKTSIS